MRPATTGKNLIPITEVVRQLKPDRPAKMRAILERMTREGLLDAETALGVTLIYKHEIPRLKRAAHDRTQDERLKQL